MIRPFLTYSALLIGLYIAVANVTGTGTLLSQGAAGIATVDRTLQGR